MSKGMSNMPHQRPGEGTVVDVVVTPLESVNGLGRASLQTQISSLPVPNKRYSADTAFLGYSHGYAKLLFGQEKFGADGELRTLLIIKLGLSWVRSFIDGVNKAEFPLRQAVASSGVQAEALPEFREEPKDTVSFDATMIVAGVNGVDGCVDFYYSSPFALERTAVSKKLAVDPVVRVNVRAGLLLGLVDQLETLLETHKDEIVN